MTPSGRFETGKKICLSLTGYHPEHWRPAWGVSTALIAIISFFPTPGEGAIGAIDASSENRAVQAKASRSWVCPICGSENATALPDESVVPSTVLETVPEIAIGAKKLSENVETKSESEHQSPEEVKEETMTAESKDTSESPSEAQAVTTMGTGSDGLRQPQESSPSQTTTATSSTEAEGPHTTPVLTLDDLHFLLCTRVPPKFMKSIQGRLLNAYNQQPQLPLEDLSNRVLGWIKALEAREFHVEDRAAMERVGRRVTELRSMSAEQRTVHLRDLLVPVVRGALETRLTDDIVETLLRESATGTCRWTDLVWQMELRQTFGQRLRDLESRLARSRRLSSLDLALILIISFLLMLISRKVLT